MSRIQRWWYCHHHNQTARWVRRYLLFFFVNVWIIWCFSQVTMEKFYQQREKEYQIKTFSPVCQRAGLVSDLWCQNTKSSQWHLKHFSFLPGILESWSKRKHRSSRGRLPAYILTDSAASWPSPGTPRWGACTCPLQPHWGQLWQPGSWSERKP